MWYKYIQNNSGGYWKAPDVYVMIEADNSKSANKIAKSRGLYFGGKSDCPCCGNRLYEADGKPCSEKLEDLQVWRISLTERANVALAMIVRKSGDVQLIYSYDTLSNFIRVTKL